MDLNNNNKEFIYFLQHPEKQDHYLIMQLHEITFADYYDEFNRQGKYANGPATLPYNKVKLVEKVSVPDRQLFGLQYYICNETGDIIYKEDERVPYGEWGWYIVTRELQINKWLKDYLDKQETKKQLFKATQKAETIQTSLF